MKGAENTRGTESMRGAENRAKTPGQETNTRGNTQYPTSRYHDKATPSIKQHPSDK